MDALLRRKKKSMEKKLDGIYTRTLQALLNKVLGQYTTKQLLYGHQPTITKTMQVRRTRHAGHCWRRRDELISDIFLRTPSHIRAKAGRQSRTYIQHFYADSGCNLEDLPGAMVDRDGWGRRVREIHAGDARWWWWWHIYMSVPKIKKWYLMPPGLTLTFIRYRSSVRGAIYGNE